MKNGLVIADSGPIFSLAVIHQLDLLNQLFTEIKVPKAVWNEITLNETTPFYKDIVRFFKDKVQEINSFNELTFIMDYGESESVILYKELKADFLLIDDKKARTIAESLEINCIGTIGLLAVAKNKGFLTELKPIFEMLLANNRYYSLALINSVLLKYNEPIIGK